MPNGWGVSAAPVRVSQWSRVLRGGVLVCALLVPCLSGTLWSAPKSEPTAGPIARVAAKQDKAVWEKDGLTFTIKPDKERKTYLKEFYYFSAEAQNNSKTDRTISATIVLHPKPIRGKKNDAVLCLVYVEVPAGSTRKVSVSCRSESELRYWDVLIQKVWDLIP